MVFAAHVTMDTSVTPCVHATDSIRSCAYEASPELRSSPASADIPELDDSLELPRSEKGGESLIHRPVTTRSQMGENSPSDVIQSEYTNPASDLSSATVEEGSQGLNQSHVPEGNKPQGTIKEATPVALRTRSRLQTAPIIIDVCEGEVRQTNCDGDNELIQQLTTQIRKQQCIIDEMSSAVKHFLKVQSTVKKLQGTITKLSERLESQKKFKVITQQVVKPLTPAINSFLARDAEELDMPYHHIQGRIKNISFLQSDTSEEDIPEGFYAWDFKPGYDSDSSQEEITPKKNSSPNDKIGMQHCHQCALVATPRKHRLTFDTPVSPDTPDSDIEQLMRLGPKKFSWHPAMETTMATDNADAYSEASEFDTSRPEQPPPPIQHGKSKKRDGFIYLKSSKTAQSKAYASILQALGQVHRSVHSNPQEPRDTRTLYVGNIDYNASEEDLREALDPVFKQIRVEKVTIPRVNGRSLYGFIEISWPRKAPVQISDICIANNSGKLQVNSRPIYFRELRNKK